METITPTELAQLDDAFIVDVRERDEYAAVHAPGVTLIPLSEFMQRWDELPADRPLHVICHSGGRSAQAAQFLEAQGREVVNVTGGTSAWVAAGLPTESGAA